MKNILVLNRNQASELSYSISDACIIISIDTDGIRNQFAINDKIKNIGYWTFEDVETGETAITQQQADEIAAFVMRYIDSVNTIIVQCDGGVSRSAGIGAAIMKWANDDDSSIFNSSKYCPNMRCFRLMLNAMFIDMDDIDIKDRNDRNVKAWRKANDMG